MNPDQLTKLAQLRAITNANNGETDAHVLESVEWDVQVSLPTIVGSSLNKGQKAVELLFDDTRPAPSTQPQPQQVEPTGRGIEQFQMDDSSQAAPVTSSNAGSSALSILSLPFTLTFNLLSYILRFLRLPVPRVIARPFNLNWNAFASLWRPGKRELPGTVAERWVRALEDEVGGLTWGRMQATETRPEAVKEIPDFYLGSYGDALGVAKRELRVLCIILVSDEHQDVPRFKRYVQSGNANTFTDESEERLSQISSSTKY